MAASPICRPTPHGCEIQCEARARTDGPSARDGTDRGPTEPSPGRDPTPRFHLVESDKKKWAFLKHIVRVCELNAVVYGDRLARAVTQFPPHLQFSLVTSRAVGNPEEWVPSLGKWMAPEGRVALFQGSTDVPFIRGFRKANVFTLPRGTSNYLVTLAFHVEHP